MAVYRLVFNRTWKNVLLWAGTSIFINTRRGAFFCAEIWSLKASVGRIVACACLCKFSSPFKPFVEFLSFSLTSIVSTGKEQTIDSQHLFYFQLFWISLKLVIAKKILHLFARSKFSAKLLLRPIPIYFFWLKVRSDFRLVMCGISENVQDF